MLGEIYAYMYLLTYVRTWTSRKEAILHEMDTNFCHECMHIHSKLHAYI